MCLPALMLYCVPMASTDTTALTPVEVDTILADNYNQQAKVQAHIAADIRHLDRIKKSKWGTPAEIDRTAATLEKNREILRGLIAASAPYQLEYNRRPWNRYFLVKNANGHVHRGMNCSTCFPTTEYGWLVELADCDEAQMIEEFGESACTVCFPDAPANPSFHTPGSRSKAALEAKAAEKAAKDAVKAEKAIADVDGSPLKDSNGYPLKTKVAARNELSSSFHSLVYYGLDHPSDYAGLIRRLVPALEAAGVDWQKAAANAIKRAVKESVVPPNNPYRLTPEQIADHEASIKANASTAQDLLKEVAG
jgi:hypothetical protein